jgi:superfamily II DNA/RNA helicase
VADCAASAGKSQKQRLAALHAFKSELVPLLLATDVASRGLDIPTVDLVVNYDLPRLAADYVHRWALDPWRARGVGGFASGLDVPTVDVVGNHDLSRVAADYVHRWVTPAGAKGGGVLVWKWNVWAMDVAIWGL